LRLTFLASLLFACAAVAAAQTRPAFEVASVRVVEPGGTYNSESYMPTLDIAPGTTLRISNRRLDDIIRLAYTIGAKQLVGPEWLTAPTSDPNDFTRFEVMAKVPADAKKEDIPLMLQNLLEDRFKLKVHRESRGSQVYVLAVGKGGSQLKESPATDKRTPGCARTILGGENPVSADCMRVSIPQLMQQLQTMAPAYFRDGPLVDRTGLTGAYDLHLEWMMQAQLDAGLSGPTLYSSMEKLGLTLEKKKDSAEMLVVDHVEKMPTEN
jgi:uncharacterized protein (TIGR03435 family)